MKFVKALARTDGELAGTFSAAMLMAEKLRGDGASREQIESYVATALEQAWPKGRTEPWHYFCEVCSDSGWAIRTCQQRSCGRPFKLPGQSGDDHTGQGTCAPGHTYAAPCDCHKGEERRRQLLKQRRPEDAVEMAVRSKPTRLGR